MGEDGGDGSACCPPLSSSALDGGGGGGGGPRATAVAGAMNEVDREEHGEQEIEIDEQ